MPHLPARIIDAHQHAFWHGRDDRGLVADLDEQGIEYAWLLTWEISPCEDIRSFHHGLNPVHLRADGTHAGIPLSDLVRARDRFPGRFVLGYSPHSLLGDAPGLLRAAVRMYGVKICGEWKCRIPLDDPRCLEVFHVAGELGLPVVFHLDAPYLPDEEGRRVYQPEWYGGTVANLERTLAACPETKFIGHAPGFWREISGDADSAPAFYPKGPITSGGRLYDLFDRYPNLHADLSAGSGLGALQRGPEPAARFLNRYRERLFFARDYYGPGHCDFFKTLDLPAETRESIFHQNTKALVPGP